MTKFTKLFGLFMLAVIAMVLPMTSCSDREMYFSIDKIEGDIITGKQVPINNHITTHVGVFKVNVQNAKGTVTASSSNTDIAEVEVYKYPARHPELTIRLIKPGEVTITVRDEDGNIASLYLKVTPMYE